MPELAKQLGDQPIEDRYIRQMRAIAQTLDEFLNPGLARAERQTGFVLMVFPFGDHSGRANYISNGADRRDIVKLMREQIARFEGQPDGKER